MAAEDRPGTRESSPGPPGGIRPAASSKAEVSPISLIETSTTTSPAPPGALDPVNKNVMAVIRTAFGNEPGKSAPPGAWCRMAVAAALKIRANGDVVDGGVAAAWR